MKSRSIATLVIMIALIFLAGCGTAKTEESKSAKPDKIEMVREIGRAHV